MPSTEVSRMKRTAVYKVRGPCSPAVKGKWCLMWQSNCMPGPAFWYYDTKALAIAAQKRMSA